MDDARWTRDAYCAVTGEDQPLALGATTEEVEIIDAEEVVA
jgi:hypothetical protein